MTGQAKYNIVLKGRGQVKSIVDFTCSSWLANRVFVSLCYALVRGAAWERVELNLVGAEGRTAKVNGCTIKGLDFDRFPKDV